MTEDEFRRRIAALEAVAFDAAGPPAERTIPAAWLADALASGVSRITVSGAVIPSMTLDAIAITAVVRFGGCAFGRIDAPYCRFAGLVAFDACTASRIDFAGGTFESALAITRSQLGYLDMPDAAIAIGLDLRHTSVAGDVVITGASVARGFGARDVTVGGDFLAKGLHVGGACMLERGAFHGEARFDALQAGSLDATGATFGAFASFNGARIDADAYLDGAVFEGQAYFGAATIGTTLHVEGARFAARAIFATLRAGYVALERCTFAGEALLTNARLGSLAITACRFDAPASFIGTHVDDDATLLGNGAASGVSLDGAAVGRNLTISAAEGATTAFATALSLAGVEVGGQLVIERAHVGGLLLLPGASVGDTLRIASSTVGDVVMLDAASVGANLEIDASRLGGVSARTARIGRDVWAVEGSAIGRLDASHATIGSDCELGDTAIAGDLRLDYAAVGGAIGAARCTIGERFSATYARCTSLRLDPALTDSRAPWRLDAVEFDVVGLAYDDVAVAWAAFARAIARSAVAVDRQPYVRLEAALRGHGHDGWADAAYTFGREATAAKARRFSSRWLANGLSRTISGYGVAPLRLLAAVAALLLLTVGFVSLDGVAVPAAANAARYACDRHPPLMAALDLAITALSLTSSPGPATWAISDCRVLGTPLRPFLAIDLLRLCGLSLVPFLFAQLSSLWKYGSKRE